MISNPYDSGCICFHSCDEWEDYTIQEKDTLYNISVRFGVPVRMLMACNRLLNPYNLHEGQIIKVPVAKSKFPGCMGDDEESYIIQLKDTLYSISEKYNTSVDKIIELNPWLDPYNLKPGIRICVPKIADMIIPISEVSYEAADTQPSVFEENKEPLISENDKPFDYPSADEAIECDGNFYIVKPEDSLEGILDSLDYTYASLAIANPNIDLFNLTSGTKLCIPMHDMFRACNSGTIYILRNSDTISSLCQRFGITHNQLLKANPFMRTKDFSVAGKKICIPE